MPSKASTVTTSVPTASARALTTEANARTRAEMKAVRPLWAMAHMAREAGLTRTTPKALSSFIHQSTRFQQARSNPGLLSFGNSMNAKRYFLATVAVVFGLYAIAPTVAAVSNWSTTPSDNATADAANGINWSEGMA